jgi:SRSO17 transposase
MVEPRVAIKTTSCVDNYCAIYQHLFPEVRSFEAFKFLQLGMILDMPRKYPASNSQSSRAAKSSFLIPISRKAVTDDLH